MFAWKSCPDRVRGLFWFVAFMAVAIPMGYLGIFDGGWAALKNYRPEIKSKTLF
jgi:hypothetical protein